MIVNVVGAVFVDGYHYGSNIVKRLVNDSACDMIVIVRGSWRVHALNKANSCQWFRCRDI